MNRYKPRNNADEVPKIIQVLPVPRPVTAVYDNEDGTEYRESVILIALYSDGDVSFLSIDQEGIFDRPDEAGNFKHYEFG